MFVPNRPEPLAGVELLLNVLLPVVPLANGFAVEAAVFAVFERLGNRPVEGAAAGVAEAVLVLFEPKVAPPNRDPGVPAAGVVLKKPPAGC